MFGLFCNAQPSYQTGGASAPVAPAVLVPTAPIATLLGDVFSVFGPLWQATPRYDGGQPTAPSAAPSAGFLCWLVGTAPTPAYQTFAKPPTDTAIATRESSHRSSEATRGRAPTGR